MWARCAAFLVLALLMPWPSAQTQSEERQSALRSPDNDNDFANATQTQSGQSYQGDLDSSDDLQDIYTMSGNAGQVFNVSVYVPSHPNAKVRLLAYDAQGALIEESALGERWESLSLLVVKTNVPYYFSVALVYGLSGSYVLYYTLETPPTIGPQGYFESRLERVSDNPADWYVFTMTEGTNGGLNNDLAQFTIFKDQNLTIDVIIYALWIDLWSYTYNISINHPTGGMIQAAATYTGSYYLKVWAQTGAGSYNVSMGVLQSSPSDNDPDGPRATKITNVSVSSSVDQALDHYDFYKLYLVQGDELDVAMTLNQFVPGKYMIWLLHIVGGLYTPVANASNFLPGIGWVNNVRLIQTISVSNRYFIVTIAEHGLDSQGRVSSDNANANYTLKVNSPPSTNHAPIVVNHPGYVTGWEDTSFSPFNLYSIFDEPDGDRIGFSVAGSEHLAAELSLDGTVTIKPAKDWSGDEEINLTAFDNLNASMSLLLHILIYPTEDRPVVAKQLENLTMWEDGTGEINLSGILGPRHTIRR